MDWNWPIRIGLTLLLTGLLGYEREASQKAAGLRTTMLVGMGACLFALVSLEFPEADSSRVAAQVVTGVGFLGAGVIFRRGGSVRGLTTAANLWVVAAIGVVVGLGHLAEASMAAVVAFVVLGALKAIEVRVDGRPEAGREDPP